MSWRIHLTNQAIQSLYVLSGRPAVLAAWTQPDRVHFYDLADGTALGNRRLDRSATGDRQADDWQEFAGSLIGPKSQTYLPHIQVGPTEIFVTDDGKLRLYREGDTDLFVETDGEEFPLDTGDAERILALDLDRALGMIVALDERGRLHVFQQHIRLGVFDIGLNGQPDLRASVSVSRGGGSIYASDGRHIVQTDSSGKVARRREMHYYIGRMACSPSGGMIVTSDIESGVLRVYNAELTITHQRFAIDLAEGATQVQLIADLPPSGTAVSALVSHTRGTLAFAMSGVIVVTDVSHMDELPRPKALL